jgi:hypothetical protein
MSPLLLSDLTITNNISRLAMGNVTSPTQPRTRYLTNPKILFLIGLTLIIGTTKTLAFFARKQKWKGTLAFCIGVTLILMRWAFFGFIIELYGILVLFGDFFATIAGFVGGIPVVGPWIAMGLNKLGGVAMSQESQV